jgi:stalled ribosome alternative rescue factor ArfA
MKPHMKSGAGNGQLLPARNAMAKALAQPLFRQRIVKSKKSYNRQQNQSLSRCLEKSMT